MPQSKVEVWIHMTLVTKDRLPLITKDYENEVFRYIREELEQKLCVVKIINGTEDHVHVLYKQSPLHSLSDTVKHVKGVSSHRINFNDLMPQKFSWQKGYHANSVSRKNLDDAFWYIKKQKEHHKQNNY